MDAMVAGSLRSLSHAHNLSASLTLSHTHAHTHTLSLSLFHREEGDALPERLDGSGVAADACVGVCVCECVSV